MNILIIGDTHFHNWKYKKLVDYQYEFMNKIIPDVLKNNSVDSIVLLGDLFESRRLVDKRLVVAVFEWLETLGQNYPFFFVLGNHDFYDLTYSPFEKAFKKVKVISKPEIISVKGVKLGFLPWNYWKDEDMKSVSEAEVIFCHLEIKGHKYSPVYSYASPEGLTFIPKDKIIFNGHYHIPSDEGSLIFVGSILQKNLSDLGSKKSVILFNSDSKSYERIPLPHPEFKLALSRVEFEEMRTKSDKSNIIPVFQPAKLSNSSSTDMSTEQLNVFELVVGAVKKLSKQFNIKADFGLKLVKEYYEKEMSYEADKS